MTRPLVSVVIPTHNRRKIVERLIDSILASSYEAKEIIVIDDASSDKTFEYLRLKFSDKVRLYVNKKNLFTAESRNVGQRKAKGEFVMFIDDDNVIDKDMIGQLVKVFSEQAIGLAGPINYDFNHKNKVLLARSTRNMLTTKTSHIRSLTSFNSMEYWNTDDIPNAFMVRSSIIRKNKIQFRKFFGIMYEESDYAYRIRKLGYRIVFVRKAKIYHDFGSLTEDRSFVSHFLGDSRRPFIFARNRVIFHLLYSNMIQNLFILTFWIWVFAAYYIYNFLSFKGNSFSIIQKVTSSVNYILGSLEGLRFLFHKRF